MCHLVTFSSNFVIIGRVIFYTANKQTNKQTNANENITLADVINATSLMKKALRETQTLRALAVVRFGVGHRPPAVTNPQTGPITIHCAAAS